MEAGISPPIADLEDVDLMDDDRLFESEGARRMFAP